jgi:DNA-binding XRE family transcriptional regulator
MEKLILRRETLAKALKTLEKSLKKLETKKFDDYQELRDSIIQRFEYSTDTFWKYLKDHLRVVMGIEIETASRKNYHLTNQHKSLKSKPSLKKAPISKKITQISLPNLY